MPSQIRGATLLLLAAATCAILTLPLAYFSEGIDGVIGWCVHCAEMIAAIAGLTVYRGEQTWEANISIALAIFVPLQLSYAIKSASEVARAAVISLESGTVVGLLTGTDVHSHPRLAIWITGSWWGLTIAAVLLALNHQMTPVLQGMYALILPAPMGWTPGVSRASTSRAGCPYCGKFWDTWCGWDRRSWPAHLAISS